MKVLGGVQTEGFGSADRLIETFSRQRALATCFPYPPLQERKADLKALKSQLIRYQELLAKAIDEDFSSRSFFETKMLDVLAPVLEINHLISHVERWMRPSRRRAELLFLTNRVRVVYQPKGVVGVVVPWNFPVYLAVGPLAAALAAGNRVMIKMSEAAPATTRILARLLGDIFPEEKVAVFGDELADPAAFTRLPFNHIVFTGSPAVGKLVMRAAAENLTPVTLELGGKSPAVVSRHYAIDDAARRIVHGKTTNAGQICVSPDYALVPRERVDAFVDAAARSFASMYGTGVAVNDDYTAMINEHHFKRVRALLDDAIDKGATVTATSAPEAETSGRKLPLYIVTGCTPEMSIMREELFGPILPVVPYDTFDDIVGYINSAPPPLALYAFSRDSKENEELLRRTHSGGVTINDWGWHVVNHDAPFGGVGNSGMGTYHGEEGFRELSHAKTVFERRQLFPTQLFHPPYGTIVQRLTLRLFLGRGDRSMS